MQKCMMHGMTDMQVILRLYVKEVSTMAYKRKTVDCYAIEGNCGYGWDIECNCDDRADAKKQQKTYRENVNYPVRIKKWRERIGE